MVFKWGLSPGACIWLQQSETKLLPGVPQDILCYQDWTPPLAKKQLPAITAASHLIFVSLQYLNASMAHEHCSGEKAGRVLSP